MNNIKIQFNDLKPYFQKYRKSFHDGLNKLLDEGDYILGKQVELLENKLSSYLNAKYTVALGSGTDALILALKFCGVKDTSNEVITTSMSYLASTSCIHLVGGKPVFVDIGNDLNMDPQLVEKAITTKTKAIIVVHLGGNPANIIEIKRIAKKYNIFLIEDSSQSIGAKYNNKMIGTFGDIGVFSLHPLKNLGALGDAGFICCNNKKIKSWFIKARNHGHTSRNNCTFWSMNSRLDTIQAIFLNYLLDDLSERISNRRAQAKIYNRFLKNNVKFPLIQNKSFVSYNFIYIIVENRNNLIEYLKNQNIEVKIHYPIPIHKLNAAKKFKYKFVGSGNKLKNTDFYSRKILSLPSGCHLNNKHIRYVCESINKYYSYE